MIRVGPHGPARIVVVVDRSGPPRPFVLSEVEARYVTPCDFAQGEWAGCGPAETAKAAG